MKIIRVKEPANLDNLVIAEGESPTPGADEILVKAGASSLNFHDYLIVTGKLPSPDGRIPMSDVAGEVIDVGANVSEFVPGDTVMGTFFPDWLAGEASQANTWGCVPGDSVDGYAREYIAGAATAFTHIPTGYTLEQAATLPCAGVTAWRALFVEGNLQPGDTVLVQGTGGVSMFALQLAKAAGATVIATSSSNTKLEQVRKLGADHVINYKETPKWGKLAASFCPRGGVDHVVEVGGAGTLGQSINAVRTRGNIALIGVLAGLAGELPTAKLMMKQIRLHGITVGSREHQLQLVRALNSLTIRPVIDATFALDDIASAFRHQEAQSHVGKICLRYS